MQINSMDFKTYNDIGKLLESFDVGSDYVGEVFNSLSDSTQKLILSGNLLTEQQKRIITRNADLSMSVLDVITTIDKTTISEQKAASSTFSLSSAFKGLAASLEMSTVALGTIVGVLGTVAVGAIAYKKWADYQEELRKSAHDVAITLDDQNKSIDSYVERYKELRTALQNAKGNEEAVYSIKKDLLTLQNELNDSFGEEYGKLNLVTDAYKDQTDAIKNYNKEISQSYLNENVEAIKTATNKMKDENHYNLSYTGETLGSERGKALKEIADLYSDRGITLLDETGDGSYSQFSIHLNADAEDAYATISDFMSDLSDKAIELGNKDLFSDILDISSDSLNRAKDIINEYGEIYKKSLKANIAADDNLSYTYNKAVKAVEDYNKAVLSSEDPYSDDNVKSAWNNLQTIKRGIQENSSVWGEYSSVTDDVFEKANDSAYSFYQMLQNDESISNLASNLKGLSNTDLESMYGDDIEDSFDVLCKHAEEYGLEVKDVIDLLVKLGIAQGQIAEDGLGTQESPSTLNIQQTIDSMKTKLLPAFDSLKSSYQNIFTEDGFTLENVDLTILDDIKSALDEMADPEGLNLEVDYSSFEHLVNVLTNVESTEEQVHSAFDSLATSILGSTTTIKDMDESTANLVASMLESMGVANANEVVFGTLQARMEAYALQEEITANEAIAMSHGIEFSITSFLNQAGASETARNALFALIAAEQVFSSSSNLDVSGKVAALKQLATAYGQTAVAARIAFLEQRVQWGETVDFNAELGNIQADINNAVNNVDVDFSSLDKSGAKSAGSAGAGAADAYLEAFEEEIGELDDLKNQGKISEKQYLDGLRSLYQKYFRDKEKYAKEYAKYESEYLDGMKSLYESAFSYITKQIDKRIDAIEEEKDSAIEALEEQKKAAEEAYQAQIDAIEDEIEALDDLAEQKQKEIDLINDAADARKREIDFQKAQYNLEKMQNQETAFVYRDGVGMTYETDTTGIRDAREELEDAKREVRIGAIEDEIKGLEEQKDILEEQKELIEEALENSNKYFDDLIEKTEKQYDAMIEGMEEYKEQFTELAELMENAKMEATLEELGVSMEAILGGSQEEFDKLKTAYVGVLNDIASGNDMLTAKLHQTTGITNSYLNDTKSSFDNLGTADFGSLPEDTEELATASGNLATSAGEASTAMGSVGESTGTASTNIGNVTGSVKELQKAIQILADEFANLEFPDVGGEGYADRLREIAGGFANIRAKCMEFSQIDFSSIIGTDTTGGGVSPAAQAAQASAEGSSGAGNGFMGLASAISDAVSTIWLKMNSLSNALNTGNEALKAQSDVITNEYIPMWEKLQSDLANIIGVGGSGQSATAGAMAESAGSIIDTLTQGGELVSEKLQDPWLKSFQEFATGENSVQSICTQITEIITQMAESIQEQCEATARAIESLSNMKVSGTTVDANGFSGTGGHFANGTVGNAFATGTHYNGLSKNEKNALRSEYGQPELTVYPNGQYEVTTTPTISDLPKGTVIFNERQTRSIFRKKKNTSGKSFADGTDDIFSKLPPNYKPITPDNPIYELYQKATAENIEFMKSTLTGIDRNVNRSLEVMMDNNKVLNNINTNNNYNNPVNVTVGDIYLSNVQDAGGLAHEINTRFPSLIKQKMHSNY